MFKALLMAALFLFGISPDAHAQAGWQFTTIDVPGASTDCYGIRPDGRLTGGGYIGSDGQTHGWLRNRRGEFSWFDYPDANFTKVQGINSHGEFTGNYRLRGAPMGTRHGYLWNYGELITFDPPGSVFKEPYKINERGGIAGRYFTVLACGPGHDESHGFVRPRDGEFTLIDFPDGTGKLHRPGWPPPHVSLERRRVHDVRLSQCLLHPFVARQRRNELALEHREQLLP